MSEEFDKGYKAGKIIRLLGPLLNVLGWNNWPEPNDDWQYGFLVGFEQQ